MFRHIFLLILFFNLTTSSFAFQIDSSTRTVEKSDSLKTVVSSSQVGEVLDFSQILPEYPGGIDQLRRDVFDAYQIPISYMKDDSTGGTMVTQFTIFFDGSIGDVTVIKRLKDCEECNQNAVKAIEAIPEKFTPGYQDGEAVNVRYTFPITIKIDNNKKKKKKQSK